MSKNEMWDSVARSTGELAGVFEYDGETGYFYLYTFLGDKGHKITGAIHVVSGTPDFEQGDIAVRWGVSEDMVGLFIRSQLWAAFDCKSGAKYGGNYSNGSQPEIPEDVSRNFEQ